MFMNFNLVNHKHMIQFNTEHTMLCTQRGGIKMKKVVVPLRALQNYVYDKISIFAFMKILLSKDIADSDWYV